VGDLHLGRRARRLPPSFGSGAEELTPEAAWRACVKLAQEREVHAVLLAGDVVERIEDRFRAYTALESGVSELTDAGIRVLGVTGNHDVEALPRLAARLPKFELLGAGGRWERADLGDGSLGLWGWSFPERSVRQNPLADFPGRSAGGAAEIGLLHADLDAGASPYAPVPRADLTASGLDAWLVGHVHQPDDLAGERPMGYLGSVLGTDPGEAGPRGPWLVEVHGPGQVRCTPCPIAALRWERVEIDCAALESDDPEAAGVDDLADRLDQHLRETVLPELAEAIGEDLDPVRALGVRVVLRGKVTDRMAWREACDALESTASGAVRGMTDIEWSQRGTTFFVEKIELNAQQAVDLVELARDDTYPGLLARRLVALERMDEEGDALLERAEVAAGSFGRVSAAGTPPTPAERREELRQHLLRAGRDALDELLAQGQRLQPSAAVMPQAPSGDEESTGNESPEPAQGAPADAGPQGEVETEEATA
jgi:DNA repair exonuclease SbcCD nuclease subunit